MNKTLLTKRRFTDGDHEHLPWQEEIFTADATHKCPTYVHKTPPCQGACPAGEDIRGWLNIVRGIEKPPQDVTWQEYAFRRLTDSNPFPAVMGRVCPAPCEVGCNRKEVEDRVGINSVEQFIGDYGLEHGLKLRVPGPDTGKKVAIVGGGPAGLSCASHLRWLGHACTIFEAHGELGGMMRYGIPGYRTPRQVLGGEIQRILDLGVEVRTSTKVGTDISLEELRAEFDAVFVGAGAQGARTLPVPGGDAVNCVSGIAYLEAFNEGRLLHTGKRVLVVGGGDTAMDVAAVSRRLGHVASGGQAERPENVVLGNAVHDPAGAAKRQGADVLVVCPEALDGMPASDQEVAHVAQEGVEVRGSLMPVEVLLGEDGRAVGLRLAEVDWSSGKMEVNQDSVSEVECDLIVAAIGQINDLGGLEALANGEGRVDADGFYRIKGEDSLFAGGDVLKPHLLTTAIGSGRIAAEGIDSFLRGADPARRPKVDVDHFRLLEKLRETGLGPADYGHGGERGTFEADYAIHNYEDRSRVEIVGADELYLGHFAYEARRLRGESEINSENVLGSFDERTRGLSEEETKQEAARCMSCGMCFECNNCIIYCPQDAVFKVKKSDSTMGRYVDTDYTRCIGCHICEDVCPTGYIKMGLGE